MMCVPVFYLHLKLTISLRDITPRLRLYNLAIYFLAAVFFLAGAFFLLSSTHLPFW